MFEDPEPQDSLSLGQDGSYGDQNASSGEYRRGQLNPGYGSEISVIVKDEEEAWTFSSNSAGLDHPADRGEHISIPGASEQGSTTDAPVHRCPECGKESLSLQQLKKHQRLHEAEKTFVCSACMKCFLSADSLNSHRCKQSAERGAPGELPGCPLYGEACASREAPDTHTQTHAGEEPCPCFVCGKTFFPQLANFRDPLNAGEKLFSCPECENSLNQRADTRVRETSHAGERYQSHDGGQCLSQEENLRAEQQARLGGYAQDQNLSGQQSAPLSEPQHHLENPEVQTASGQRAMEAAEKRSEGVKVVSGALTDQTLRLTIRLHEAERDEEEEIVGFINSDGEEVEVDARHSYAHTSDSTGSSQTALTTSKGGTETKVQCQNHRENGSPTLMMEVTAVEEEEGDKAEKKAEEIEEKTTGSTYHVKTRGRRRKAAEVPVNYVDPAEDDDIFPVKSGKRRGRKKKTAAVPVESVDGTNSDSGSGTAKPAKRRYTKRKTTIPAPEGGKDVTMPAPAKRRYKKRKLSSADGATDSKTGPPVKRRPGRKMIHVPIEIPPELLKKPKEKINYHCSICGKDFPHSYKLERHQLTHTGEKPYCCSICGRGFNQKGNLKTHYKVHTGRKGVADWPGDVGLSSGLPDYLDTPPEEPRAESSLRCLECGKECESLSALQAHHVTTHAHADADANSTALQLHLCRRCGVQFSEKQQLSEHMKSHTKEKPYSCPDCGKRFINESYIQVHQRIHTGEKPFLCSQCGKGYHTASSLKLHEMQHSGDRPFACLLCEKKFRINSYLTAHYQTHIKNRPFLCSVCGKGYARAEELKVHHRIHTGERPYQCGECGKSFIYRQGLRQHQRTHAGRRIGPTRQLGRPKQQARMENLTIAQ